MLGPKKMGPNSLSFSNVCQSIKMGLGRWQRLDDDAIFQKGTKDTKWSRATTTTIQKSGEKNQKAITCKNYYNSNNKHNSRLIDPRFKVQIGYLTVNRQTNKQMGGAALTPPAEQMEGVCAYILQPMSHAPWPTDTPLFDFPLLYTWKWAWMWL